MAGFSVEIQGLDELNSALVELVRSMTDGATAGQEAAAASIAEDWRANVPVDTGEYQDSIDSDEEFAFAMAEHAGLVEFGTSTHSAQPVGSEAAELGRSRMSDQVADEVKGRLP